MLVHVAVGDEAVQFRPVIDDAANGGKKGVEVGIVISLSLLIFNEGNQVGNVDLAVDADFVFLSRWFKVDGALHLGSNLDSSGIFSHVRSFFF